MPAEIIETEAIIKHFLKSAWDNFMF
jgi:hypothetical protein